MNTIWQQIHNNAVALVSIFIAISTLAYNTWRNETTEEQRKLSEAIQQTRVTVMGILRGLD